MVVKTKKPSEQWGMSNLFGKISKNSAPYLTKAGQEKFWQKLLLDTAQLNGFPSISAKIPAFPSVMYESDSKTYHSSSNKP